MFPTVYRSRFKFQDTVLTLPRTSSSVRKMGTRAVFPSVSLRLVPSLKAALTTHHVSRKRGGFATNSSAKTKRRFCGKNTPPTSQTRSHTVVLRFYVIKIHWCLYWSVRWYVSWHYIYLYVCFDFCIDNVYKVPFGTKGSGSEERSHYCICGNWFVAGGGGEGGRGEGGATQSSPNVNSKVGTSIFRDDVFLIAIIDEDRTKK